MTPRPRLSTLQQALLSAYWFATSAHWTAILLVAMPSQVLLVVGDETKGQTLGTVLALGAIISMVAPTSSILPSSKTNSRRPRNISNRSSRSIRTPTKS